MGEAPRSDETGDVAESKVENQEHEDQDQLASAVSLKQDSLLVFDWDDTILPTSWLLRVNALTADAPMRPEVQRQVSALALVALKTLNMAQTMGTVIIITNSAPGWVDQSCQLFMPQLLHHVRGMHIAAKPLNAPLTFKINAFRRECRQFRNIVSIGDGDAERVAILRLQGADARSRMSPTAAGSEDLHGASRLIKSVKLLELPTCQQLISQHGMLQGRLRDVTAFQGSLDLKARAGPAGAQCSSPRGGPGAQPLFSLVHFGRAPGAGPPAPGGRGPGITGAASTSPARMAAQPDEGTRASAALGAARSHSAGPAGTAGGAPSQLPLIGRPATQDDAAASASAGPRGLLGRGATTPLGGALAERRGAGGEAPREAPEPAGGGAREDAVAPGAAAPGATHGGTAAGGEALWKVQMRTGAGSKTAHPSPPRRRAAGDANAPYPSPTSPLSRSAPPMAR
ncbi:unnamed protein product [Prorocentrum cordatum]|uniref:Protein-serine/threonine phosphatase n=1 Tax=Prorocentrum cordatum TaxID=2364126 RepID=A0ABN9YC93_9DINO|nr:unnamed protein product [Polarella glacialis]